MKDSKQNVIQTPGYHMTPKYDLQGLRKKINTKSDKDFDVVLPLTPMIDMFSMLVIFLLLNFSATGEAFFVNKSVKLPEATNVRPLKSHPLVSIQGQKVYLDAEALGETSLEFDYEVQDMPQLRKGLQRISNFYSDLEQAGIEKSDRKIQINIQADQLTPVGHIKHVMNILIQEGFTGINFAVREEE